VSDHDDAIDMDEPGAFESALRDKGLSDQHFGVARDHPEAQAEPETANTPRPETDDDIREGISAAPATSVSAELKRSAAEHEREDESEATTPSPALTREEFAEAYVSALKENPHLAAALPTISETLERRPDLFFGTVNGPADIARALATAHELGEGEQAEAELDEREQEAALDHALATLDVAFDADDQTAAAEELRDEAPEQLASYLDEWREVNPGAAIAYEQRLRQNQQALAHFERLMEGVRRAQAAEAAADAHKDAIREASARLRARHPDFVRYAPYIASELADVLSGQTGHFEDTEAAEAALERYYAGAREIARAHAVAERKRRLVQGIFEDDLSFRDEDGDFVPPVYVDEDGAPRLLTDVDVELNLANVEAVPRAVRRSIFRDELVSNPLADEMERLRRGLSKQKDDRGR
jgi:hypothetical protein